MKKIVLLILVLLSNTLHSQCPNTGVLINTINISCPNSTQIQCIQGGQYINLNVINGNNYIFSTCGGLWDSQITLYNGGLVVGYNDDFCGLQSSINWTSNFTGVLSVYINQYFCTTNISCIPLTISCFGPSPQSDCIGAIDLCNQNPISSNSNTFGTQELNINNRGCLLGNEHQSTWYRLNILNNGNLNFNISPNSGSADYDFAIWGPNVLCPVNIPPIRCSFSAINSTGLNSISPPNEFTDGINGILDGWVYQLPVLAGETYLLLIDNYSGNNLGFNLNFNGTLPNTIGCIILPINFGDFIGEFIKPNNVLKWFTYSENNSGNFYIEKSKDLIDWDLITLVESMVNSNELTQYTYTDKNPKPQINYYRLIQEGNILKTIFIDNTQNKQEIIFSINILGQQVDENYKGLIIDIMDNNTYKKRKQ